VYRTFPMRCVYEAYLRLGLMACLTALAGCATSSTDQVQEVGGGIYSIGVRSSALTEQAQAVGEAARKAGAFCHAKGQKLQVVTNTGDDDVHFRCVGSGELPTTESATQEAPKKEETH
jgi:hypothetical protein